MNQAALIFLGVFIATASSFYGLIVVPQAQVGRDPLAYVSDTGAYYPGPRPGEAQAGAEVYRANGCVECHTQQVRPKGYGSDYERDFGRRRTIAQDYLLDSPVQLGSVRLGPDLANIGRRQTNDLLHWVHLYNPRLTMPESSMPRYPYLFNKRPLVGSEKPGPGALPANTEPGFEITPRPEALQLVAYLRSLKAEVPLYSAPFPLVPTNAAAAKAAAAK
jgi:cytochrome c oxidase cbb3-type subunit 2